MADLKEHLQVRVLPLLVYLCYAILCQSDDFWIKDEIGSFESLYVSYVFDAHQWDYLIHNYYFSSKISKK